MRQTQNTQKKDNRKSIFVIALLLLLVAVIGFGGYTLSKYVTKKSETGSASVAKWGYTITADASGLFGKDYKFAATNSTVTNDTTGLTVSANNTDRTNRVAPGTTGSMTFSVKGTAEVLAQVTISIAGNDVQLVYTEGTDTTTEKTYAPIKWTLKKGDTAVAGLENVSFEKLKTGLASYKSDAIAPGATPNETYTLSWVWDFDDNGKGTNDGLDTLLGMIASDSTVTENGTYKAVKATDANDKTKTNTVLSFDLTISIVQLQQAA